MEAGVPFAWFASDEEFGLRDYLETSRISYMVAVPKTTRFTDTTGKTVQLDELAKL